MYETFDHTADLGLRIRAPDLNQLFADAAQALFSVLVANLDQVRPVVEKEYRLDGAEPDYLLFDWLSELLYEFETHHLLFAQFEVEVDEHGLRAVCRGEPMDLQRHTMDHEVKAITYHELKVERERDGWMAEVIVDI